MSQPHMPANPTHDPQDHTVYVWTPATSKKPLVPRLTGLK